MEYSISNGLVHADGYPLRSSQLYKLGRLDVSIGRCKTELVISRRPAELRFMFCIEATSLISIFFRGKKLDLEQVTSVAEYGYFIVDFKRVYFCSERIREHVIAVNSGMRLNNLIKFVRKLHSEGFVDSLPDSFIERVRESWNEASSIKNLFVRELYAYQQHGVEWLTFCATNGIGTLLADDMGLGKTAQVIAMCCQILQNDSDAKILIVLPNPLIDNWVREFNFFAPSVRPYIHHGPDRQGVSDVLSKEKVILTPYTTMSSDIGMLEEIVFDLVLYDEASMLKNHRSSRSVAARRLKASASVAISGTPIENSLMDAWAICDLVFPGYLGNEQDFRSRYMQGDIASQLEGNLDELEQSLQQITLRRLKRDVLKQLPERIEIHKAITANDHEREVYDAIIEEMHQDNATGAKGILPLISKLQQFTAHPALLDTKAPLDLGSLVSGSAKFELLMMTLDAIVASGEKVIIFATFRQAIDLIRLAITEKYGFHADVIDGRTPNEKRQPMIDEFSSTKGFSVLLLHPRTAGMGLNITAASHVIHYCRQWNPALEEQCTARAWRNGQSSSVSVHYFYYANTIEEMIDERLRLKRQLSDHVVTVTDQKETDKQLMLEYLESTKNEKFRTTRR